MKFEGKKVWITGGGTGIGKAIAAEFAREGAKLILSGRNVRRLESAKASLESNQSIDIIPLDLEDHEGIVSTFEENIGLVSDVDILVNNAGISQRSLTTDTEFKVYKKLMDVNFLGTVQLSILMLKEFEKRGKGHFVVNSSSAGKFGVPLRSGYSASKFALHGFFEALRAETYNSDINVTMICPGFINTDISLNALSADGSKHGTMDDGQKKGMPVETMAKKSVDAIYKKKEEFLVGGFKESQMSVMMSRFFPSTFRKMIANMKVT